jgi:hypothetical protein
MSSKAEWIQVREVPKHKLNRCSDVSQRFHSQFKASFLDEEDDIPEYGVDLNEIDHMLSETHSDLLATNEIFDPTGVYEHICEFFRHVRQFQNYSDLLDLELREFLTNANNQVKRLITSDPFHLYFTEIKGLYDWIAENAGNAIHFTITPIPSTPTTPSENNVSQFTNVTTSSECIIIFISHVCEKDILEPKTVSLRIDSKFIQLVIGFVAIWNLKLWIIQGGREDYFFHVVDAVSEAYKLLDKDCPIIYKYYKYLKLNDPTLKLTDDQFTRGENHLNECAIETTKYAAGNSALLYDLQFKWIMGNYIPAIRQGTKLNYKYNSGTKLDVQILKGDTVLLAKSFSPKYFNLIKILTLIYKTKFFVECFNDYDGKSDLIDMFKRVCEDILKIK